MREIKFRAWNKEYGIMDYKFLIWAGSGRDEGGEYESIMQYTGLKDKNGVEIYESDYLSNGEYEYIVEWDNKNFCWNGRNVSVPTRSALNWHDEEISVWGNIHQHPELML